MQQAGTSTPDATAVARIVGIADPLERNAAITRGYHDLSGNWLTFGQWASAEAGRSIAGEAIPAPIRGVLGNEIATAVVDRNAAIFADVAPPFIRFVAAAGDTAARSDAPNWESYDERMGFIFTLLRAHQRGPVPGPPAPRRRPARCGSAC